MNLIRGQPGSQPTERISLLSDSFCNVQRLIGLGLAASDEDEGRGGGVMIELWEAGREDAGGRGRIIDGAQWQGSTRQRVKDAKG